MTDKKIVRDVIHACSAGQHGSIFSPPKYDVVSAFSRISKLAVKKYKCFAKE